MKDEYRALSRRAISEAKHTWAIARHFRIAATAKATEVKELLEKALEASDDLAVIQCLILSVKLHDPQRMPLVEAVFIPAISYLIDLKDTRWVTGAWFMKKEKPSLLRYPRNTESDARKPLPVP